VETDECGGPEFFSNGTKILTVPGENGKVHLPSVEEKITRRSDIHYPKPRVLSITQPTEVGTVYSIDELRAIQALVKKYNLRLHMDGARFANAIATLGVHPSEITWKVGVDVLCFGGTKNGMSVGEAVVFFNRELAYEFDYRCKQAGQLASKMRFISAPWIKMLESGAWLKNAKKANELALSLREKLSQIPEVEIMYPCQANSVFVKMPQEVADGLRSRGWYFYNFIGMGYNRLMCSWDTKKEDINDFVSDLSEEVGLFKNRES
jgi:threonine aldolase